MLWAKVHAVETMLGEKIPTIDIMESWAKVIMKKGETETILVADSYYLTEAARSSLSDLKVRYLCSIQRDRFAGLVAEVEDRVEKPGQWASAWNDETGELLTHYWSTDKDIGKRFVLTNAFFKENGVTRKALFQLGTCTTSHFPCATSLIGPYTTVHGLIEMVELFQAHSVPSMTFFSLSALEDLHYS